MIQSTHNLSILIVDDEAQRYATPLQEMLADRLPDQAINFIVRSSYRDALDKIEGASLVIVGLDLTQEYNPSMFTDFLPRTGIVHPGHRLIRFIQEKFPSIKIIALQTTSLCQEQTTVEVGSNNNDYNCLILTKPISASTLIDAIRTLLHI